MKQKTVAILTNFMEFNPGYSLTGIVSDQAHMLLRNGHKVIVYVNENYNAEFDKEAGIHSLKKEYSDLFMVLPKTKFMHLIDYSENNMNEDHTALAKEAGKLFYESFVEEEVQAVFTHDFVFTGWNLPYYHAIKETSNLMRQNRLQSVWFHWIHSVPSGNRDWWDFEPLGLNHHIAFPNKTEIMRVAESFKLPASRVKIFPHIKDIRNWYDFSKDTRDLLDEFPQIIKSEVIQIYPCSTDRLDAKQLLIVIQIFAQMKIRAQVPVFLVIANQWATGLQRKEDVQKYIDKAEKNGLIYKKDFIFTSEIKKEYATGISKRMIRELQLLQNLFIFPTREESFGLVGPEASFSGALTITNRSLLMMQEVMSQHPPSFEFGSFHNKANLVKDPNYINAVAMAILNRLYSNEAIMTKVYCRIRYNMENIYTRYYLPNLG